MKIFKKLSEFEWDKGNSGKNFLRHKVSDEECEEVFFDRQKKLLGDVLYSQKENRYILIGQTKAQRPLFIVFTIRQNKIRVISGRPLNKKERSLYEQN